MKPCANQQKRIAALALDLLEPHPARELQAHLEICAGCRDYLAELTRVAEQLAATAPSEELPASDQFHRRVMARIEVRPDGPDWRVIWGILRAVPTGWRLVLPLVVVILVLTRIGVGHSPKTAVEVHSPAPASVQVAAGDADADLAPTVANYQRIAEESPDKLDELLARQEPPTARAMPVYTASSRTLRF
jgi:predicted anti-sigma-YlaC factor YlaD